MRPGQLDQRITLERVIEVPDGLGGVTRSWAALASNPDVWAAVRAVGGDEGVTRGQVAARQQFEVTIRARDDLTEADRVLWRGDELNIRHIERWGGRAMYMTLKVERGIAN